MRGLSIDIGVHNMAFYIEEFDYIPIENLSCDLKIRYDKNGEPSEKWKCILENVYKNGKNIFLDRVNLSEEKGTDFNLLYFINLTTYLDSIKNLIDTCSFIVVEQQVKRNPMAQRLEQHCISWLTFTYLDTKQIIVFPASNKTRVLGAPKRVLSNDKYIKFTKYMRKKWACDRALDIFSLRNDIKSIDYIFNKNKSKKDDLSDVVVQIQAFKIKCFIDKKIR